MLFIKIPLSRMKKLNKILKINKIILDSLPDLDAEKNKRPDVGSFIATAVTDLRYPCFAPWPLRALFVVLVWTARREQIGGAVRKY